MSLDVITMDTIGDVKVKIEGKEGYPQHDNDLFLMVGSLTMIEPWVAMAFKVALHCT